MPEKSNDAPLDDEVAQRENEAEEPAGEAAAEAAEGESAEEQSGGAEGSDATSYTSVTDALGLPIVVLDDELRLKHYTPRATELFDLAPSEVGHPFSRVSNTVDDCVLEEARRALSSEGDAQCEMQVEGRWYMMRATPHREKEALDGVLLTFLDITERKRTEENLRESEVRLRLLMENLDEYAIFTLDVEGKITSWNAAAEHLFQYGESEVIGRIGSILYTAEDRRADVPKTQLDEARQSGQSMDYRWVIRKDGSRFWAYGVTVALFDSDDRMRGYARVVRDTSDGKRSQEKLARVKEESESAEREAEESKRRVEESRAEAERASQAKSQFLANMSHELRTPLNSIIGYSDMMLEDLDEEEHPETAGDLNRVLSSGRHLLTLVNDVLDLSKIEAGRMELSLTDFDVETVTRETADAVRPRVEENDSRLEVEVDDDVDQMHADETKLRQSLTNLLSNAAKFTEGGTVALRVRRERHDGRRGLVFEVADTGIGMTEEEEQNLFEAFEQASEETSREYGGTGLGLAITRNVCRLMGGGIELESEKGVGSTFTIWLPATVEEDEEQAAAPGMTGMVDRPSAPGAGAGGRSDGDSASSSPAAERGAETVLVIDDDADVRNLLDRRLSKQGFRVKTASSGAEGVHLARRLQPAAITLDVRMPDMDGWEALSLLKDDDRTSDVPVIMLTISDEGERGYRLGADDFLNKPVDRDKLSALLEKYRGDGVEGTVLVVEDDDDARELVRRTLESDGHEVCEATNGREALQRLEEEDPGLILLDLMMPQMDGFEFLEKLRADEQYSDVPVIVVTAKELGVEERRYLSSKVEETLQKSEYTRGELLSEVERRVAATRDGGDPETEPAPREPAEDAAAREAAAETGPDASTAGDDLPEGEPFSENDDESLPGEEPPAREETSEAPSDEDPEAPVEENPSAAPVSTKEDPDDGPREDETSAPEEAVSEEADPDETPPEETASREDTGDDADAAPTPNAEAEEDPEAADDDAPPAQPPADEEPSESRNAPAADPADGEGKPLILLVEDNEHNYDMLSRRLRRRGYEVELATDGQTGVEKAEAVHPNLILMDINLPVLNGKEATRRIRAFPEGGQVPIIALTAHAMSGDREEALEAGCDRYHSKPVELPELMEQIEELLAS